MPTNVERPASDTHDWVSIGFHWATVLLLLVVFTLALFPGIVKGSTAVHMTLGLLFLIVIPARGIWRLFRATAPNRSNEPRLSRLAATSVHLLLYALLILIPLLGWVYADARGIELSPLGIEMPRLADFDRGYARSVYFWKKWAAYSLLGLIFCHASAAIFYHHFLKNDGVLRSMLPLPSHGLASGWPAHAGQRDRDVILGQSQT